MSRSTQVPDETHARAEQVGELEYTVVAGLIAQRIAHDRELVRAGKKGASDLHFFPPDMVRKATFRFPASDRQEPGEW